MQCGYSICHNGYNICHLLNTCSYNTYHNDFPSVKHITHKGGNNICHKIHGTTSANTTMAITPDININQSTINVVSIHHCVQKYLQGNQTPIHLGVEICKK